jgi:hypothetical protein
MVRQNVNRFLEEALFFRFRFRTNQVSKRLLTQNRSGTPAVHPEYSSSNLYTVYLFSYYAYSIALVHTFVNWFV